MIEKREIINAATTLNLNAHVIEKDYVLGWLLWGIYNHELLAGNWIFKGGTCLKKCFFETYRFSEDLDFTLTDVTHIDSDFLAKVFGEIGAQVYEKTDIEFSVTSKSFEINENRRGRKWVQGRIGYRGPISPRGKDIPKIKLDLIIDECIVLSPAKLPVFHPYSDGPEGGIVVDSYAYEEAFAEKIRALGERARPRDLYDVITLFRNQDARPSASVLLDVLQQKCEFKDIHIPILARLEQHRADLEGGWSTMLAHQLPALPPVETYWDELPAFFEWLNSGTAPKIPPVYIGTAGEELIREPTLRLPLPNMIQSYMEVIRFAGSNRLQVELDYQGTTRRIEPYSLRRTTDGNVILHSYNIDKGEHRSYRVDRIRGARATGKTFVPRFAIELTAKGPYHIPGSQRTGTSRRATASSRGLTYVYECNYCGKRFNRKKRTTTLNPHKDNSGYPCAGRYASFVDMRY